MVMIITLPETGTLLTEKFLVPSGVPLCHVVGVAVMFFVFSIKD